MNRRDFIRSTSLAGIAAGAAKHACPSLAGASPKSRYDQLNSAQYLEAVCIETTVDGAEVFTEGPAADARGNVFFTNIPAEQILKWDPAAKQLSVFRSQSQKANGLLFDPQGRLLVCEGAAGRVTRIDIATGETGVLADQFKGLPFAPPNDLALDQAGRIYFTSRPSPNLASKGNVNAVYRIDPDGTVTQLLKYPEVHMPNGVVTSPDDKLLYLVEAHPDAGRNRHIRVYDLKASGTLSNPRLLIDFYPGRSGDGMCIDQEGNLYVAAGLHARRGTSETLDTQPGIHVIAPDGRLLAFAQTPEDTVTNCTFGGEDLRTLYVTCGSKLLSIRTRIPGKPAYRPKP